MESSINFAEGSERLVVHIPEFVTDDKVINGIKYIRDALQGMQQFLDHIDGEVKNPALQKLLKREFEKFTGNTDGIVWRSDEDTELRVNIDILVEDLNEGVRFITDFYGELLTGREFDMDENYSAGLIVLWIQNQLDAIARHKVSHDEIKRFGKLLADGSRLMSSNFKGLRVKSYVNADKVRELYARNCLIWMKAYLDEGDENMDYSTYVMFQDMLLQMDIYTQSDITQLLALQRRFDDNMADIINKELESMINDLKHQTFEEYHDRVTCTRLIVQAKTHPGVNQEILNTFIELLTDYRKD